MSTLDPAYDPTAIINDATDVINEVNASEEGMIPRLQYAHVQAQSQLMLVMATELHAIRLLLEKQAD
jgi:hypothetical protein